MGAADIIVLFSLVLLLLLAIKFLFIFNSPFLTTK